jgi:hypothetical protein
MRLPHILVAAIVGLAAPLATVTPAAAGVLDVTCTPPSTNVNTYTPPLTATPQTVVVNSSAQYSCVSATVPGLTSGTRTVEVTSLAGPAWTCSPDSPSSSPSPGTPARAAPSPATRPSPPSARPNVTTLTGTVTAGLFTGDTVVSTSVSPSAPILLCTLGLGTVASTTSTLLLSIPLT